jgi:hypothetical protein
MDLPNATIQDLTVPDICPTVSLMSVSFVSSRELSKHPGQVLRNLKKSGLQVVTQNGQPAALMVAISPENLEVELMAFRRFQLGQAVERLRSEAAVQNLGRLPKAAIAAEIQAVRAARHSLPPEIRI